MKKELIFDFTNPNTGEILKKQYSFFCEVLRAVRGESPNRVFHFGGGIRGGKTYTCLFTLLCIANEFPGVKIHIVRDSMPNCLRTVEQSFLKLCRFYKRYYRGKDNPYIELQNGSRIHFFAENFDKDKELDRFKGLETNIFFLEQIEELQEKTFFKALERTGTWLYPGAPPGIILTTFNPTPVKWIREMVYQPYKLQKTVEGHYTVFATAKDNPHIPDDLWKNWGLMDSASYKTFVEGDWEVYDNQRSFCYAFNPKVHVQRVEKSDSSIYISFDFNVDPAVCLLAEVGINSLYVFREYRLRNSNIYELCNKINDEFRGQLFFLTGDASGNARSHVLPDNITTYDIIRKQLSISKHNFHVPLKNLGLRDSRLLCNHALEKYDIRIDPSCEYLIIDLLTVESDDKGVIQKTRDPLKTHLLDCFRYYCNTYFLKSILANRHIS